LELSCGLGLLELVRIFINEARPFIRRPREFVSGAQLFGNWIPEVIIEARPRIPVQPTGELHQSWKWALLRSALRAVVELGLLMVMKLGHVEIIHKISTIELGLLVYDCNMLWSSVNTQLVYGVRHGA